MWRGTLAYSNANSRNILIDCIVKNRGKKRPIGALPVSDQTFEGKKQSKRGVVGIDAASVFKFDFRKAAFRASNNSESSASSLDSLLAWR
jgi:hypothetical protein